MKYEIIGGNMPVVICQFDVGDSVVTQAGGMSWHTEGVMVNTEGRGGLGKMFGRALAGESMFQNVYTATRNNQEIAFASNFPGSILPVELTGQNNLIVQKQCFLASDLKVNTSIFFQKRLGAGFFGGEGFMNTVVKGPGKVYIQSMPLRKLRESLKIGTENNQNKQK